jgi:hypothetical protein
MTTPTEPDDFEMAALRRFRKDMEERFAKLSPERRRALAERLMDRLLGKAEYVPASKPAENGKRD